MAIFEVNVDDDAVTATFRKLGGPKKLRVMRKALNDVGFLHTRTMAQSRFKPYTGRARGRKMQNRSGALRRSIGHKVDGGTLDALALKLFVASPYARIQEEGGTITAKRSRFLTIPTKAALTRGGAQSGRFRIRKTANGFRTDVGPTFIFKSRGGNLLIGVKSDKTGKALATGAGRNKQLKAIYILRRSVKIPPRLRFKQTFRKRTRKFLDQRIQTAGDEIVQDAVQ